MNFRERLYALAAALGCTLLDAAACLCSLAGNGRPDSLAEHFASVPRDPEPTPPPWANDPTPIFDAILRVNAIVREITFGSEDFAEWDRELMVRGEDA